MATALTPEEFTALAGKSPTAMQKGLATFIAEVTGKKVSAQTVATVQRFSGPYRATEHYAETKAAWTGGADSREAQRRAEVDARKEAKLVAKREKLMAELARLGGAIPEHLPEPKVEEPAAKPARKSRAKAKAEKPRLVVVADPAPEPVADVDEDDTEEVAALDLGGTDEFVTPEPDADFGLTTEPVVATAPVVTFDDVPDYHDEDDDDDDF